MGRSIRKRKKKMSTLSKINIVLIIIIILLLLFTMKRFNMYGGDTIVSLDEEILPNEITQVYEKQTDKHPVFIIMDEYKEEQDEILSQVPMHSLATIEAMQNIQYQKEIEMEKRLISSESRTYEIKEAQIKLEPKRDWDIYKWKFNSSDAVKIIVGGGILILSYYAPSLRLIPVY